MRARLHSFHSEWAITHAVLAVLLTLERGEVVSPVRALEPGPANHIDGLCRVCSAELLTGHAIAASFLIPVRGFSHLSFDAQSAELENPKSADLTRNILNNVYAVTVTV